MCRAGLFRQNKCTKMNGIARKCTALSKIKWITKKCAQVGCQTTSRTITQPVVWGYAFDTFDDRDEQFSQCIGAFKQHPEKKKNAVETPTICPPARYSKQRYQLNKSHGKCIFESKRRYPF